MRLQVNKDKYLHKKYSLNSKDTINHMDHIFLLFTILKKYRTRTNFQSIISQKQIHQQAPKNHQI